MRLLYKTGPMESLRKWFYKPKRDDRSLLAQFFFADDALNMIAAELDSFDGRKDPERCSTLVNQLRHAQDRVLNITSQIMDQLLGDERVARGFRVKFPEDVLQDNLAGQLWFGAECLAAGSSIMNREEESAAMRPLAKALTRSLETVRSLLREQCLRPRGLALSQHDDMLHESLRIFDRLFAEFELCYVSAMVNVKTPHEFEAQQLICVLFSESLRRALKQNLLTQEQVDSYDPALMFAVPRLAIVSGLLIYSSGPLSIDKPPEEMSDMFRPFRTLLHKIRSLLWTLDRRELMALERLLCTNEDVSSLKGLDLPGIDTSGDPSCYPDIGEFVSKFYADHAHCRDLYNQPNSQETVITESDYLPDNIEVMTPIIDGLRRLSELEGQDSDVESNLKVEPQHETSTDTFQTDSRDIERTRKTSRGESSDLSSLRNLSTNGLMMFDPLVINAVSASTSGDPNRQIPDQDLVTSLNEQVTEIADRLSSIVTDTELLDHNSNHSFSTNDVPTLIATESPEPFGFSGPRNEQLSGMPSTSHGYLIPNAISQEPVILASLSHNNSVVFNQQDMEVGDMDESQVDVVVNLVPDNVGAVIVNTNLSMATVNLSSLLLTNDEFRQNFRNNMGERDRREGVRQANTSCNRETGANNDREEKTNNNIEVKVTNKEEIVTITRETSATNRESKDNNDSDPFMLTDVDPWVPDNRAARTCNNREAKNSDNMEPWAENTESLVNNNNVSWVVNDTNLWASNNPDLWATDNRAPSTNSQEEKVRFMVGYESDQDSPTDSGVSTESTSLDRSPETDKEKEIKNNHLVQQNRVLQSPVRETNDNETKIERSLSEENTENNNTEEDHQKNEASSSNLDRFSSDEEGLNEAAESIEPRRIEPLDDHYMTVEELITKFQRARGSERKLSLLDEYTRRRLRSLSTNSQNERQRKSKKSSKKKSKMWSPGSVILDNRSTQSQNSPLRLDLDHFVDESETPSGTSECADDEQIALALQAQELAARQQARGKFKSSEDLIHRLFVCIAGVADQLQTNFAADLRNILKSVFLMNQTPDEPEPPETPPQTEEKPGTIEYEVTEDQVIQNGSSFDSVYSAEEVYADSASDSTSSEPNTNATRRNTLNEQPSNSETRRKSLDNPTNLQASVSTGDLTFRTPEINNREENASSIGVERAPEWVPDIAAPACMRCSAHFTAFRRRHHCRNCGKVFCASCSSNSIPLPRFGQLKPVRVCEECYRCCETVRSRVR